MKSHTKHIVMHTRERMEFVNITSDVERELKASGVREGLCLVNAMHIPRSSIRRALPRLRAGLLSMFFFYVE